MKAESCDCSFQPLHGTAGDYEYERSFSSLLVFFFLYNGPQVGIKQKGFLLLLNAPGQGKVAHCRNMQQLYWTHLFGCRLTHFANPPITRQPLNWASQCAQKKVIKICGAISPFQDEFRRFGRWQRSKLRRKEKAGWRRLAESWRRKGRQERQLLSLSLQRGWGIEELQPAERRRSGRCHYK